MKGGSDMIFYNPEETIAEKYPEEFVDIGTFTMYFKSMFGLSPVYRTMLCDPITGEKIITLKWIAN